MRTRPAWFRGVHAATAVLSGIAVGLLFTTDIGLTGRLRHTVIGLALLGVLYSLSQVRPPSRVNPDSPSYPVDTVHR